MMKMTDMLIYESVYISLKKNLVDYFICIVKIFVFELTQLFPEVLQDIKYSEFESNKFINFLKTFPGEKLTSTGESP